MLRHYLPEVITLKVRLKQPNRPHKTRKPTHYHLLQSSDIYFFKQRHTFAESSEIIDFNSILVNKIQVNMLGNFMHHV